MSKKSEYYCNPFHLDKHKLKKKQAYEKS